MKRKPVSVTGILLKLLVILLLVLFWRAAGREVLKNVAAVSDFVFNKADKIKRCDSYYYKKNYGGLREELSMHRLTGEDFDKYHEAVKGFEDFQQYLQFRKAAEAGIPGAAGKAEQYRLQVIANAENCEDRENTKQMEEYVRRLE